MACLYAGISMAGSEPAKSGTSPDILIIMADQGDPGASIDTKEAWESARAGHHFEPQYQVE